MSNKSSTSLNHDRCYVTEPSHVHHSEPSHAHLGRHEISTKIQPKEWTTALALKHLLVSWDLWTYRIGFKLPYHHLCIDDNTIRWYRIGIIHHIFAASMRRYNTMWCWYRGGCHTCVHTTAVATAATTTTTIIYYS